MESVNVNDFNEEKSCEYKGRKFLARDNGAILRLPKEGSRLSKWDNVWTFGTKDKKTGYMILSGTIRVHQVVCTAFHGPEPEPNMVVDHIDTNRCNNRPENLRWLTRIENALNNPVTRKKIAFLCGGNIQVFIDNPAILREKTLPPDVSWMKTVTKEQAAACKKHVEEWARQDSKNPSSGMGIGDWIFTDEEMEEAAKWSEGSSTSYRNAFARQRAEIEEANQREYDQQYGLKDSLTPGAKQIEWKTPTEFPQTPHIISSTPLQDYLSHLSKGTIYCRNQYGDSPVYDAAMSEDGSHLSVLTEIPGATNYALSEVSFSDGFFIHKSIRTFISEEGAIKYFTLSLGREWDGGDVLEDYC